MPPCFNDSHYLAVKPCQLSLALFQCLCYVVLQHFCGLPIQCSQIIHVQPVNPAAWLELPVNNPLLFYLVLGVEIKSTSGFSRLCCSWEVVNPNDIVRFHSGTFYRNSLRLFFTSKSEVLPSFGDFVLNKPHSSLFSGTDLLLLHLCSGTAWATAFTQQHIHSSARPGPF